MSNHINAIRRAAAVLTCLAIVLLAAPRAAADSGSSETGGEVGGYFVVDPTAYDKDGNPIAPQEVPEPNVNYGSAIVMDADTGAVLYEHYAYLKRPMASTTKIMTSLLAIESGDIGRMVTITEDMLAYDEEGSTKLGLSLGDTITLHDLVLGMLLLSGNDCAQAVAIELGGSFESFASMMNERASQLGMYDTHFITPSGLDDEAHYSTAYDMALLGAYAMKNDDFAQLCGTRSCTIQFGNPMSNFPMNTHNYLLEGQRRGVKGCDGIKTGYTNDAGYCLVSHVERDGVSLVCCTLGAPNYWAFHESLYEYALSKYVKIMAAPDVSGLALRVIGGASNHASLYCEPEGFFSVHENQVDSIWSEVTLNDYEYAPISRDQVVGYITYYFGASELATYPIRAAENIDCITGDWLSAYLDAIKYDMESGSGS